MGQEYLEILFLQFWHILKCHFFISSGMSSSSLPVYYLTDEHADCRISHLLCCVTSILPSELGKTALDPWYDTSEFFRFHRRFLQHTINRNECFNKLLTWWCCQTFVNKTSQSVLTIEKIFWFFNYTPSYAYNFYRNIISFEVRYYILLRRLDL